MHLLSQQLLAVIAPAAAQEQVSPAMNQDACRREVHAELWHSSVGCANTGSITVYAVTGSMLPLPSMES